jgi:hypothetical protein
MSRTSVFSVASLMALFFTLASPDANAWFGFGRKEKPEPKVTQPLPVTAEMDQCEPFRQKAMQWNRKPVLLYPFTRPVAALNEDRHRECLAKVKEVQRLYLKQAELEHTAGYAPKKPPATTTNSETNLVK